MKVSFSTAHIQSHQYGWEDSNTINEVRKQISYLIGSYPDEIIFTSGVSESNSLKIGLGRFTTFEEVD